MTNREFPIIKTNKFLLRKFDASDIENIYNGLSDPKVIKYYGISFNSLAETQRQLDFYAELEKNETGIFWAICSADNELFFGAGGLYEIDKENKKAEIGFWVLSKFWKQGIMTETLPLICKYGFENLSLNRIEGFVESENVSCKNAMQKLNFKKEGTMRECEIKNGKYISLDIYAKLKTD